MSGSEPKPKETALNMILARVHAAARSVGRRGDDVELVAASKQQPLESVQELLAQGHMLYGENRVQEGKARWTNLRGAHPGVRLRLIGPLQTNKAREAVDFFDAIDTLDRERLAGALAEAMVKTGRRPEVLIEVNTGREPQKSGLHPEDADAFIRRARETFALPVRGLMCVPPAHEAPERHFTLLAQIAARNELGGLSMGMSGDFETAIRCGATMVRVGSALFGARG